jgi:hypothetical protein
MTGGAAFKAAMTNLDRAAGTYEQLNAHFERFCEQAARLQEKESGLSGIQVTREGPTSLLLEFLDRRLRVTFHFDRKARAGILSLGNAPLQSIACAPSAPSIAHVTFSPSGETNVAGGYAGQEMDLGMIQDCIALAAHLIDAGLDDSPL